MTCRDVQEALDALLDGELDAAEESRVRFHLEDCADCDRELAELREWHRTLTGALAWEVPTPTTAERRRLVDALAASTRRRVPPSRLAALLAIGISVGIVTAAVGVLRPPEAQVARVVESVKERAACDAELRAVSAEIEQDLGEARQAVAGRGLEDPTACAVAVASENIARRLGGRPQPGLPAADAERVSVVRTLKGETVSVVQLQDGRVRVETPAGPVHARSMADLLSRHADVCRRYAIGGSDGSITVGDSSAGADWKGRLELLTRTGAWDEGLQGEAYRGWLATRVRDSKEIERKVAELRARGRAAGNNRAAVATTVDVETLLRELKVQTRAELNRTLEKIDADRKQLEERLKEASELRAHAKGLRIFAEDVGRD